MADKKLSELASITGLNTAPGDLFHILDISESDNPDKNKKINRNEMINMIIPVADTYVPVMSAGWGTMDSTQYIYTLHNDLMTIFAQHVNGSVSATALTIGLPLGFKVHTDITNTIFLGMFQRVGFTSARYGVIAKGGDIFLGVSRLDAAGTTNTLTAMLGNSGMGTAEIQTFTITVLVEAV